VRSVAGLLLILALAACSRQEPPPAAKPPEPKPAAPAPAAQPPADTAVVAIPPAPPATPAADGQAVFTATCATCHMADGSGVPFLQPSIKGSAWISNPDPQLLLSLILRGSAILGEAAQAYENDMAPQSHLSDAEVAAVATYVRSRFTATPIEQPVTPAEVAVARARPGLPP
jgi:mono/diheme cytochrome c family protein